MLLELIVAGTFWFWAILGGWTVGMFFLIEHEKGFWATMSLIGGVAALWAFTSFNPLAWVFANKILVLWYVGGYFLAGIAWGGIKWFFHVLRIAEVYGEAKAYFAKKNANLPVEELEERAHNAGREAARKQFGYGTTIPPQASENKARILMWMTHWPFSAIWTLINDPVRRIFDFLYRRLSGGFQRISNAVFARHGWNGQTSE